MSRPMQRLRDAGIVLALALFTWLYADRQLESTRPIFVPLKIVPPAGTQRLVETDLTSPTVQVQFRASAETLDQLSAALSRLSALEVPLPADTPLGEQTLNTASLLRDAELIRDLQPEVISVTPQQIRVEVDEYVRTTMNVSLEPEVLALNPTDVIIEPQAVNVTLPRQLLSRLTGLAARTLLARTAGRIENDQRVFSQEVPISAPFETLTSHPILLDRSQVSVSFRLPNPLTLKRVPGPIAINVLAPPEFFERWSIEARDRTELVRPELAVRVPALETDLSRERVLAYIDLRPHIPSGRGIQAERREIQPEVRFILPPSWQPGWDDPPTVRLILTAKPLPAPRAP